MKKIYLYWQQLKNKFKRDYEIHRELPMVTCHSSVPLVTSRLQSHCQSSTEKKSKGSTSPSPGLQHKGLFHTSSCVATTRETLNMTVLQFYPALGYSPLLKRKLTPIASSQTYPLPSCKPPKSNSESHMEANTCTSKTFLRTNLSSKWWICVSRYQVTILCLQQCPGSIKRSTEQRCNCSKDAEKWAALLSSSLD